MRTYFIPNI